MVPLVSPNVRWSARHEPQKAWDLRVILQCSCLALSAFLDAEVAELADALASGASGRKAIGVRVPASAPITFDNND